MMPVELWVQMPAEISPKMPPKSLSKKPLIEAILEIKWRLPDESSAPPVDADYRLFVGRFFDRMREHYPSFETLPTAQVPEGMLQHVAQYRFRVQEGKWPLVQIGSGLLTLNDTEGYRWEDFESRAILALDVLTASYPVELHIKSLLLRYINAVQVDFETCDITIFLRDKLKVGVMFPDALFQSGDAERTVQALALQAGFRSTKPPGNVQLKFARGKAREKDAVIWETSVHSFEKDLPALPREFSSWLGAAHEIAEDWFFKLIDGDLLHQFE